MVAYAAPPVVAPWSGTPILDRLVDEAVRKDQLPGAVVLVGHRGQLLHYKAYGSRALSPAKEPMTLDTVFDAASLTKVVATTSAMMKLVESGQVRLGDPVTNYLPEFQGGKSAITVRQLMTHFSGLRPDVDLTPEWSGYDTGIQLALRDKPVAEPNARFIYSDINFVLLGEIVRRTSGVNLAEYTRREIFAPLGMTDTAFQPPEAWMPRIAPTELYKGMSAPLRGRVHDPTARFMGGIAGHAGLFTTALDLSKFCSMMLGMGSVGGKQIFSPFTVQRFTTPQTPPSMPAVRGLGWDIDSAYAGQRGDLFPATGYGHTGFTGTSIWVDPGTATYIIVMSNSVHPYRRPAAVSLRGRIASVVAANLPTPSAMPTKTGLEVAAARKFSDFGGQAVGLITNHTGLFPDGRRNIDVMLASGVKLTRLFSPEHGIQGKEDHEKVADAKDEKSGLPVYSLYQGETRKPNPQHLQGLRALVFDIQDAGARFYTYVSTMKNAMEAAAENNLDFYVLDRPNPISGRHVEGPVLDEDLVSFVATIPMPLRHGMTLGELAGLINSGLAKPARLRVVRMEGWSRSDWYDSTGQTWVDLSPNMRSLNAALLYPGVAMIEYAKNYSVGRGTDAPFEQVGADWINGAQLAGYLNRRALPGVRIYATRFTPQASYFAKKTIEGVRFVITDREAFDSTRLGLEICLALNTLYPGKIDFPGSLKLIGSKSTVASIQGLEDPKKIQQSWEPALERWSQMRQQFLLYP
ncbi:MAG: DUF1343 domain-containing protein [Bryobacteraceae bacterium]|nr:DUF1343 domain-containing protein [Bryobacteraceae bacterium]